MRDTTRKVNFFAIPVLLRTPEYGWAGGFSGAMLFKTSRPGDSLTRTSAIQTIGFFTSRQVNVQAIDASIFFPRQKYILLAQISHQYFPDKFWGIGPHTADTALARYTFEHFFSFAHLKKRLTNHFYAGAMFEIHNVFNITHKPSYAFDSTSFYGKQPYLNIGPGISLSYDSRNNSYWPTKGWLIVNQVSFARKELFATYDFTKWICDLRWYRKIHGAHTFACQLYSYRTYGNTPLRDLAALGGANNLRGLYSGRFRGYNLVSFMGEYRVVIYKKLSGVIFGGTGTVYENTNEINNATLKYNFGGGLRFSVLEKERFNLRLDYGYSDRNNKAFYFTAGESF